MKYNFGWFYFFKKKQNKKYIKLLKIRRKLNSYMENNVVAVEHSMAVSPKLNIELHT
jgi:hypothetical protein